MSRPAPSVVAIGGGHGLAATLAAVRRYAGTITAVVAVADDGGSTGRLRQSVDLPAPGDLRKCLVALADDPGSPFARSLEHRFAGGELEGHALGNLLLAALSDTSGGIVAAVDQVSRLLGSVGAVIPATTIPVVLKGVAGDREVNGQVAVSTTSGVEWVSLVPPDPPAPPAAVDAIAQADQVLVGPGSLLTSVLAALAVPDIRAAVAGARGRKVYVCNLAPEPFESERHTVADHLNVLRRHQVEVDAVLFDPAHIATGALGGLGVLAVPRALAGPVGRLHDPGLLAAALAELADLAELAQLPADAPGRSEP